MRRWVFLALLACFSFACGGGGGGDTIDGPIGSIDARQVDVPTGTVDAPSGTLDAPLTILDAPVGTADVPVGTPDGPPATLDAPLSTPDAPETPDAPPGTPDAPPTPDSPPPPPPDAAQPDAAPVCGNGVTEAGEECDDNNTMSGDGCSFPACAREIVGYRVTQMELKYPHAFFPGACSPDVTNPPGVLDISVNGLLTQQLNSDASGGGPMGQDPDGFIDLSPLVAFKPYNTDDGTTPADFVLANCDFANPLPDPPVCSGASVQRFAATATNTLTGQNNCLTNLTIPTQPNRTYTFTIDPSGPPPCFTSNSLNITLTIESGGITIELPLQDARFAAAYSGDPATQLVNGLLMGFISNATAQGILVPLPILGDTPLSNFLAGGTGGCSTWNDTQLGPENVPPGSRVAGWYFYLNFTAVRATYTDQ